MLYLLQIFGEKIGYGNHSGTNKKVVSFFKKKKKNGKEIRCKHYRNRGCSVVGGLFSAGQLS